MKKLIFILATTITLASCKKQIQEQQIKFTDVELFNPFMDSVSRVAAATMRGKPPKPPRPGEQPPATPGTVCLLIDTDGHDIVSNYWPNIHCNPSGLTQAQADAITARVKNDFSFNTAITVTRDETVFNTYPQNKRRRCVITTTNFYGNVGGVAYIGSLLWMDESPCFVFSALLGYSTKYVSDATSHEFGHTMNCRHISDYIFYEDGTCTKRNEYLVGDLLMGSSYSYQAPRFGIGPSSLGCHILQNDIETMNNTINQ